MIHSEVIGVDHGWVAWIMPGLLKPFHVSIHLVVDDTNDGSSESKPWEPNHDLSSEAETFWPDETPPEPWALKPVIIAKTSHHQEGLATGGSENVLNVDSDLES